MAEFVHNSRKASQNGVLGGGEWFTRRAVAFEDAFTTRETTERVSTDDLAGSPLIVSSNRREHRPD